MLNTVYTLKLSWLLALLLGATLVSGIITYTVTRLMLVPASPPVSSLCPPCNPVTPAEKRAGERYFKIHKPKLNGEGF